MEDARVARKRQEAKLTPEEKSRVAALRRARVPYKKGVGTQAPDRKLSAQAADEAQQARLEQEKARAERERVAVAAKTTRHLNRLRDGGNEWEPWDDAFILDLRGLLDRGLADRAATVAHAVAIEVVPWHLPEDTLGRRLQQRRAHWSQKQERAATSWRSYAIGCCHHIASGQKLNSRPKPLD